MTMKTADHRGRRVRIAQGVLLSFLETATLRGIVSGLSLRQIAEQEHTSANVTSVASSRAYRKIGCRDRFSVRSRLQELGALETLCPAPRPSAEELAASLVDELRRKGRYPGTGAVLVQPAGTLITIGCIVKIETV